jgi:exopolysaccharide biosynthesis polyprenyl glycosylphosphotransferase
MDPGATLDEIDKVGDAEGAPEPTMLRSLLTPLYGRAVPGTSATADAGAHPGFEAHLHASADEPFRADPWPLARLAIDVAMLVAATLVAELAVDRGPGGLGWLLVLPLLILGALVLKELSRPRLRALAGEELKRVLRISAVVTMGVALVALLVGAGPERVQDIVEQGLIAAGAVGAGRLSAALAQSAVRRHRGPARRTLIVGAGRVGRLTAARLLAEPTLGLRPVGFLDKEPLRDGVVGPDLPVFGASWDLERTIEQEEIETVVVAFSTAPNHVPLAIVRRCWELGVSVILIPRLFEVQGLRAVSEHIGGLPLVTLNPANPLGWELRLRYAVDRVLAVVAVLVLSPLLLALALGVRMTLGAPVLFRQARMGRDGRAFDMLKFRTMWGRASKSGEHDASWAETAMSGAPAIAGAMAVARRERAQHGGGEASTATATAVESANSHGTANGHGNGNGRPEGADDAAPVDRRTPLGRFMRKWSLDELPQLLNVVRGDMALIGPRPERVRYANEFEKAVYRYRDRARIKPGITGWAQVHGLRGQTSLADRVEWDNFYIENWSPWLDVKILVLTVAKALRAETE